MKRIVLLALSLSGCVSLNTFESPRTVPKGELSWTLALSSFLRNTGDDQAPLPMPLLGVRAGVSDDVDFGFVVSAPGHARADVKYSLLEGEALDLSIGAAMSVIGYPSNSGGEDGAVLLCWDLPILIGINVSESVSLVPSLGPGYAFEPTSSGKSAFLRTGFGVRMRLADSVSLMPQLSAAWDPARWAPADATLGLAVVLGAQP